MRARSRSHVAACNSAVLQVCNCSTCTTSPTISLTRTRTIASSTAAPTEEAPPPLDGHDHSLMKKEIRAHGRNACRLIADWLQNAEGFPNQEVTLAL